MSAENLPYFKFITEIIRSGLWAKLSSSARTLYPVLLSYSDKDFKPVYPGTKILLKMTGFKHKTSLRKARKELAEKGLLTLSLGNGRENTYYQFRFNLSPGGYSDNPLGETGKTLRGANSASSGKKKEHPPYNQIHISIDNHLLPQKTGTNSSTITEKERWNFLRRRFGSEAVRLACSECHLGNIADNVTNVEKILYRNNKKAQNAWSDVKRYLSKHISITSLDLVCQAYVSEREGLFIFKDSLPAHLKTLLQRICTQIFFEPAPAIDNTATKSRLIT